MARVFVGTPPPRAKNYAKVMMEASLMGGRRLLQSPIRVHHASKTE